MKLTKKGITWAVILVIVVVGAWRLQNHEWSPPMKHRGVVVSTWNGAMGAADENSTNLDKQKLSISVTVWNDSTQEAYVTNLRMKLPDSLRTHILQGDTYLSVNQSLNPNATYQVKGELVLDTKGMTKQEILNLGNIQGFTVETGQNNPH